MKVHIRGISQEVFRTVTGGNNYDRPSFLSDCKNLDIFPPIEKAALIASGFC
jgi:hypothetical protein